MSVKAPSRGSELLGAETPRLATPPARKLTRATTLGYEVCDFAEQVLGIPLLPWQRWLAIHALELNTDGTPRFRTVGVLVARQNGKTTLLTVLTLWRLYLDGARLVLGAAQNLDIAREPWQQSVDVARSVPELADEIDRVRMANGEQELRLVGGGRYRIVAATRSAGRGLSVDQLNLDEIREQRDWAAWSALSKTTLARPHAQTWCTSNAGDDQSVVLNHLREAALNGRDQSIGWFEWSAPDGCDLDDRAAWAQANPSLGHTLQLRAIEAARRTDPPAVFRTEVLCQKVDVLESAIDPAAWHACRDPHGSLKPARDEDRLHAFVDVAPDGRHVTLAIAGLSADGSTVRVELLESWPDTRTARAELAEVLGRLGPRQVGWFPSGPAAAIADIMRDLEAVELKGAKVTEACQLFADVVTARQLTHRGDPLLDAHVAGARRKQSGDGWRFVRDGFGHVDAAYAAAGAVGLALAAPAPYDVLESVV